MSQSPIKELLSKPVGALPAARIGGNSNKNEIRISAEGVAKLTFSFLDDHHADSSLEPGEVKTPPHGSSASPSPSPLTVNKVRPVTALHNESASMPIKRTKSTSQSDAQACQEKVRAILELDAIKRREEVEKKKQQKTKVTEQSMSADVEDKEAKRKAKEEKKRLKKLKKEKKAAIELYSEDDVATNITILKAKKKNREKESYSSEEEGENHDDDDDDNGQPCTIATATLLTAAPRYTVVSAGPLPPHLPPFPDQFLGFRPMNPFMRVPRPDFHHPRGGGFHLRGRGVMRGAMRFPAFRAPFHVGGPPRHINTILRQQTPPPARGHSPILAPPSENLIWTTTKPSISYAFNTRDTSKTKLLSKPIAKELSPAIKTELTQNLSLISSEKKVKKKLKKSHEHEKRRRSSRNSSDKLNTRKVEKSGKSYESPSERKRTKTPEIDSKRGKKPFKNVVDWHSNKRLKLEQADDDSEEMWDEDEQEKSATCTPPHSSSHATELVKNSSTINIDRTKEYYITDENISEQKIRIKSLNESVMPEGPALPPQTCDAVKNVLTDTNNSDHITNFDMFAESPPRPLTPPIKSCEKDNSKLHPTAYKAADSKIGQKHIAHADEIRKEQKDEKNVTGSTTPPKSFLKEISKVEMEKSSVQKAIEIQIQMQSLIKENVIQSSKVKNKPLSEENVALLKAIEAKNRINILLNEDKAVTPSASKLKTKSEFDTQKTSMQKAIEAQNRIDKLLKDDDLDLSTISKIKAKSLEHKRQKEKEAQSEAKLQKLKVEKPLEKKQSKSRRSFTPEMQNVRPRNPFRRSTSREWQLESRSRTRTPKRDFHSKRTPFDKHRNERRSKSRLRGSSTSKTSFNRSGSGFLNRSRSGEKDGGHSKGQRSSVDTKLKRSGSPRVLHDASKEKTKFLFARGKRMQSRQKLESSLTSQKKKNKTPLSFTASEFLFPEDDEENSSKSSKQKSLLAEDDTTSSEQPSKRSMQSKSNKDDSPDTDDYMDNWEDDDVDLDINSNNACDSSTPMRSSSQEDGDEEKFVARFVNPSPPVYSQSLSETTTNEQQLKATFCKTEEAKKVESDQKDPQEPIQKKELFGMQEIYDQFIRSVEESGVDLKSTESNNQHTDIEKEPAGDKHEDHFSTTSSTSTSSTSSSSSSSSEASNSSTSSYSSSSSSGSSSEESNDADSFKNITLDSPKPKPKQVKAKPLVVVKIEEKTLTPPLPSIKSITPEKEPLVDHDATESATTEISVVPTQTDVQIVPTPEVFAIKTENSDAPKPTAKSQKSEVAKDFKKLKSLEANLSRIQMMRANYDSADEISDELLKMEKLFLHEKNLILHKYAKSSNNTAIENNDIPAPAATTGHFVASLQRTENEIEKEAATAEANKIFDANREAIKLTISPLKLPRTPAIFAKSTADTDSECHPTEPDEIDFTEKLQKPAKEVAIVKPMMEAKEMRTSQGRQHRRSTPQRTRSPSSSYYRERRRSISRSRYSPQQRRQRGRSLSVSPPPRRSAASTRYISPARRSSGNTFSTHQSRSTRNSGRRSRSRSRSVTRLGSRRTNDRARRAVATPPGHSQPHYRKSTTQRSSVRDSRSRSRTPPRSPITPRSPPRPHSPRSPRSSPMLRRRSYSRERYLSRSPLPFKPPSPPMRRSLSPQRRLSVSPEKRSRDSFGMRRSRSHSRSRSPSVRYDDHRRHRASSFDRRSPSLQNQYFIQEPSIGTASSNSSSYYYNLSPNRISLDARINIVLNGPTNQESNNSASFENYSNYSQYGGQYMSIPPQPDATTLGLNYGTNQYVPMSSADLSHHAPQQIYSNIPTIGSGGVGVTPISSATHSNYYYNEFSGHVNAHQSSSLLKELPKAPVAVQKGNVLEIVPSGDVIEHNELKNADIVLPAKQAKTKKQKKSLSWKEEVNKRHVAAAVLRLNRENDGSSKSILKKTSVEKVASNDESVKKKVYFEDGIFPNRESDDEDRKIIDAKLRRKLRRLHKLHGITVNSINLVKGPKCETEVKTDPALEAAAPPPPPPGAPAAYLEQPIYLRPASPTPLFYFHFDSVVHSMYVSQLERPIPPRLLNPKAVPSTATGPNTQSPSNTQSPNSSIAVNAVGTGNTTPGITNTQGSKKELSTLAAINRSSNNERSSPKLLPSPSMATQRQRNTQANTKTVSSEVDQSESSIKNSFHALPANVSNTLPPVHMSPPMAPMAQRQSAPIGFMGMRINNFMRLPPSPLARHGGSPLPQNNNGKGPAMAIIGMRHSFNMPPPSMMPPQQISLSSEFSPHQQQHYHPMSHPTTPHMHNLNQPYPVSQPSLPHSHQHPHFAPTGSQIHPHHMYHLQHHRQQSPQFFMQSLPPPPPLPPPSRNTYIPPPDTAPPVGEEITQLPNSPQAMVPPYNIQR